MMRFSGTTACGIRMAALLVWAFSFVRAAIPTHADEGAAAKPLQYRRVFVPIGDLPVIDRKLIPVERSELEKLIEAYNTTRSPISSDRQASLVQSVYIAELIGSDLISAASRLRINAPSDAPTGYRLEGFSPALRIADFEMSPTVPSDRAMLSSMPAVGSKGEALLDLTGDTDYWFGWSLRSTPDSEPSKLHFRWRYPTCLDSRLFLKLPAAWTMARSSTVSRPVIDPAATIGDAWTFASPTDSEGSNWWCLELSGSATVDFTLEYHDPASLDDYQTLVRSERVEYFVLPDAVETTAVFELDSPRSPGTTWLVRIEDGLRVQSVKLDEASTEWHRSKVDGCIEVVDRRTSSNRNGACKLKITGPISRPENEGLARLPRFRIEKAFTLDGHTEIAVHPDRQLDRLVVDETTQLRKREAGGERDFQRWEYAWTGTMPDVRLQSTTLERRGNVESLSRITNESDGLACTGWALFNPERLLKSSCRLQLSSGWILESAQSTDRKQSVAVERIPSGDSTHYELRFNPPMASPVNVELRLRYPWTSGQDAGNASELVFEGDFPYRIEDWACRNFVWLETVGRYKLEANTELLAGRIDEQQVPEFHRSRLPRIGDVWLIQAHETALPRLAFVRQPSPYNTNLETSIYPGVDAPACVFRLQCTPLAGVVNAVTAELAMLPQEVLRWRQRVIDQDGNESWIPAESRKLTAKEASNSKLISESRQLLRIDLKNPMSESFELEGRIDFSKMKTVPSFAGDTFKVPLLSFPEAAQQEAVLLVDRRQAIAGDLSDSPFIASGHAVMLDRFDGLRYRYNPVRTTDVAIESVPAEAIDGWITNGLSRLSVFIDGRTTLHFAGHLRREASRRVELRMPAGWSLVQARLGKQSLDVSSNADSSLHYVWMPNSPFNPAGSVVEFELAGPKQSLDQDAKLEFPSWNIDIAIVAQHREVWLPPGFSLSTRSNLSWFQPPSWELRRLLPSAWWRSVAWAGSTAIRPKADEANFVQASAVTPIAPRLAWTSEQEAIAIDGPPKAASLHIVRHESRQAFGWLRVFVGFALVLCIGWFRRRALPVGLLVLIGLMVVVSPAWLVELQQLSLGWLLGLLFRFIGLGIGTPKSLSDSSKSIYSRLKSVHRNGESATQTLVAPGTGSSIVVRSILVAFGLAAAECLAASCLHAADLSEPSIKPFDIVIPINDRGEAASSVVYVSDETLQQLYRRPNQSNGGRILSVDYTLKYPSSSTGTNPRIECVGRYRLEILTANEPFVWPLKADESAFSSMFVDGEETTLGSRLKWDEKSLTWIPNAAGVFDIELQTTLVVHSDGDRDSISLPLLPVVHARLAIESDELAELNTNGLGRLRNLRNGRYEVDLGAVSRLEVDWRPTPRNAKRAGLQAEVSVELALTSGWPTAKSTIHLEDGIRPWEEIDLECDAGWKPIGKQWGDAWLVRTSTTASSNRLRYRLARRPTSKTDPQYASTIEIYWTKSPTNDPLVGVPIIELPMIAAAEPTLKVCEDTDSLWQVDGLQGWESLEATSGFAWRRRSNLEWTEYRSTMQAGVPFLRRKPTVPADRAVIESEVDFEFGRLGSRTSIRWSRPPESNAGIGFEVATPDARVRVTLGGTAVPFTQRTTESGTMIVMVFPKSPPTQDEAIEIELHHAYRDDAWTTVPVPIPIDGPIESLHIEAKRTVDRGFTWQGIEGSEPKERSINTGNREARVVAAESNVGLCVPAWSWSRSFSRNAERETSREAIFSSLPRFQVDLRRPIHRGQAVLSLEREDQAWTFRLKGRVEAGSTVCDGVLLEVPTFVADAMECVHRFERLPSPEAGRRLLYLFADRPSAESAFDFELTSVASTLDGQSTTSFPEVRLLGNVEWQEWLVIPRVIEDQEARWLWSGARIDDQALLPDFLTDNLKIAQPERLVLTPTMNRPRIRLGNISAGKSDIVLSLVDHRIRAQEGKPVQFRSTFWLVPRGHQEIVLNVPRGLEFQTVNCNGRTIGHRLLDTTTQDDASTSIRLRLLSAALPQRLNVYFAIRSADEIPAGDRSLLAWPSIEGCSARRILVNSNFDLTDQTIVRPISPEAWITFESESSWDVVEQATGIIAEIPLRERTQWWEDWQTANANAWLRTVTIKNQEVFAGISERRRKFCDRFQLAARAWETSSHQFADEAERLTYLKHYELVESPPNGPHESRHVARSRTDNRVLTGWGVAVWLVGLCGMAYWFFGFSTRWAEAFREFMELHPWWIWVVVGLVVFFLLPTHWLGCAFIGAGLGLAARTYLVVQRRSRLSTR